MGLEISNFIDRSPGSIGSSSGRIFDFQIGEVPDAFSELHRMGHDVVGGAEGVCHERPGGASPIETALDASEGSTARRAPDVPVRWRFRGSSAAGVSNSPAVRARTEHLLRETMLARGDAAPVMVADRDVAWDLEIAMPPGDKCRSADSLPAFSDAPRHRAFIYPEMSALVRQEQVETPVREIGHVSGLRYFAARITETASASGVFGENAKVRHLDHGADSRPTDADRCDLERVYDLTRLDALRNINRTPVGLGRLNHESGLVAGCLVHAVDGSVAFGLTANGGISVMLNNGGNGGMDYWEMARQAFEAMVVENHPQDSDNWATIVPMKVHGGWGLTLAHWLTESQIIVEGFEQRIGRTIGVGDNAIVTAGEKALDEFQAYLVAKANVGEVRRAYFSTKAVLAIWDE